MASTDLKIKSTYGGKAQTLTISDANTEASDDVLLQFGQKIIQLTDNVYGSTDKVTTVNLDTESGASKQAATITLNKTSDTLANVKTAAVTGYGYSFGITCTGDGVPYAYSSPINTRLGAIVRPSSAQGITHAIYLVTTNDNAGDQTTACEIKIVLPETDNYKAASATFTITA